MSQLCWPRKRFGELTVPKDMSSASAVLYSAACTAIGMVVVAFLGMFNDWRKDRRTANGEKLKSAVANVEAQLNHEDKFQVSLLARIEMLERRDDERNTRERERESKINSLELGMENLRGQVKELVVRLENIVAAESSSMVYELRDVLTAFRALLDMAPIQKSPNMIGNTERTHAEEKSLAGTVIVEKK